MARNRTLLWRCTGEEVGGCMCVVHDPVEGQRSLPSDLVTVSIEIAHHSLYRDLACLTPSIKTT